MPVFNNAAYVAQAIDSILSQSFGDFELVIVDDGSTDHSLEITRSFQDKRIRIIQLPQNVGISKVLSIGWNACRADLIAKMDADDLSHPDRLTKQFDYLRKNPQVDIVGGDFEVIGNLAPPEGSIHVPFPQSPATVRYGMFFRNCLMEPSMCGRRTVLTQLRYDDHYRYAEEYEAHLRHEVRISNLPDVLIQKRDHGENISIRYDALSTSNAERARQRAWERILGRSLPKLPRKNLTLIKEMRSILLEKESFTPEELAWIDREIRVIRQQNRQPLRSIDWWFRRIKNCLAKIRRAH